MKTPKTTVLRKIGNSLGVIIPSNFLHAHGWKRGDEIAIYVVDGESIIFTKQTTIT